MQKHRESSLWLIWTLFGHRGSVFNLTQMAMVAVDGSSHLSADSQPKSVGLVWGLVATRRSVCIHQMNRVNSRSDHSHEDSTINASVRIIIINSTAAGDV